MKTCALKWLKVVFYVSMGLLLWFLIGLFAYFILSNESSPATWIIGEIWLNSFWIILPVLLAAFVYALVCRLRIKNPMTKLVFWSSLSALVLVWFLAFYYVLTEMMMFP